MRRTHLRVAIGSFSALFAIVLGASVLPNRTPASPPPKPLAPDVPEQLVSQPLPAVAPTPDRHAGGPYTFAREMETPALAMVGASLRPQRLGGAALHPRRDSEALPPPAPTPTSTFKLASLGQIGGASQRSGLGGGASTGRDFGGDGFDRSSDDETKPDEVADLTGDNPPAQQSDENAPGDQNPQPGDDNEQVGDNTPQDESNPNDNGDQLADNGEGDLPPPPLPTDPLAPLPGTPGEGQPSAEVPEPSAFALLGVGAVMLGLLRRRRR